MAVVSRPTYLQRVACRAIQERLSRKDIQNSLVPERLGTKQVAQGVFWHSIYWAQRNLGLTGKDSTQRPIFSMADSTGGFTGFLGAMATAADGATSSHGGNGRQLVTLEQVASELAGLHSQHTYFTAAEVVWRLEGGRNRAPLSTVVFHLESLVAEGRIRRAANGVYCYSSTKDEDAPDKLELARGRIRHVFTEFRDEIDDRIKNLSNPTCNNPKSMWNCVASNRRRLGFRGAYLFVLGSDGMLEQKHYTSDREQSYREAAVPSGMMKQVLEADELMFSFDGLAGLSAKNIKAQFIQVGLGEVEESWISESLIKNGIGSLHILKLVDEAGHPTGVLLLRDAVLPHIPSGRQQKDISQKLFELGIRLGQTVASVYQLREPIEAEPASGDEDSLAATQLRIILDKLSTARIDQNPSVRHKSIKRGGRLFEDYTIDNPRQFFGSNLLDLVGVYQSIWPGYSEDFVATVVGRASKIKLTVEVLGNGEKVPVAYHIITRRDGDKGTYFEIFGLADSAQDMGFSHQASHDFIKEAFIEDAARAIVPTLGWFRLFGKLRVKLKIWMAFRHAMGKRLSWKPKAFKDIKTRVAMLTDTGVAIGPWQFIEKVSPQIHVEVGQERFMPSETDIKDILPDSKEPIAATVEGVPVYLVKCGFGRQTGKPPAYQKDGFVDRVVAKAIVGNAEGVEKGHYDIVVFLEATIEDFRRYYQLRKQNRNIASATASTLGSATLV